jgi:DNA-binding GntR family transcriptional regulator
MLAYRGRSSSVLLETSKKAPGLLQKIAARSRLNVVPLDASVSLRALAYDALKRAITGMDIYGEDSDVRLDERQLSRDLGVSRTPIREALTVLEQEGFVRSVPRRGIFVIRKSKREIIELIQVWAALESMAARLAAERASDADLAELGTIFSDFETEEPGEHLHEYSEANIRFHQTVIRLGGCALIEEMTENLFLHMRAIRAVSVRQGNRAVQSKADHERVIAALRSRDADAAETAVREHALGLAAHVARHGVFYEE